jgi:hypothetical protein
MRALSIRQPWASLIVNGSKPIENRTWKTRVRGWVLVHASRSCQLEDWLNWCDFAETRGLLQISDHPKDLQRGGIIGAMRIDDCVTADASPWFTGPYGFVIGAAVQLPFFPVSGKQGFFNPPLPGDYVSEVIKALRTIEPEIGLLDLF